MIQEIVVIPDESGIGIDQIIEMRVVSELPTDLKLEDIGEGYWRIEGAEPNSAGEVTFWYVEETE